MRGIEHALGRDDGGELFRDTLDRAKRLAKESGKAAMFVLGEPESNEEWRWKGAIRVRDELAAAGVAVYPDMDRATRTMGRYLGYLARRRGGSSRGCPEHRGRATSPFIPRSRPEVGRFLGSRPLPVEDVVHRREQSSGRPFRRPSRR